RSDVESVAATLLSIKSSHDDSSSQSSQTDSLIGARPVDQPDSLQVKHLQQPTNTYVEPQSQEATVEEGHSSHSSNGSKTKSYPFVVFQHDFVTANPHIDSADAAAMAQEQWPKLHPQMIKDYQRKAQSLRQAYELERRAKEARKHLNTQLARACARQWKQQEPQLHRHFQSLTQQEQHEFMLQFFWFFGKQDDTAHPVSPPTSNSDVAHALMNINRFV
ncbi:hypothetical protein EDD86DRAFT_200880, partial [Gorgonomyces haynaldii]